MSKPDDVLSFWLGAPAPDSDAFTAKVQRWFYVDKALDAEIRTRFGDALTKARDGALDDWAATPRGRLGAHRRARPVHAEPAPRHAARLRERRARPGAGRGRHRRARGRGAAVRGEDVPLHAARRTRRTSRARSATSRSSRRRSTRRPTALENAYVSVSKHARGYLEQIRRFGRFPHRNAILGRTCTQEEMAFLAFSVDKRLRFHPIYQVFDIRTDIRPTVAEVDLAALRKNVDVLAGTVGPGVGILAVVKADAYGHGALAVRARARAQGVGLRRLAGRGGRRAAARRHRGAHRGARQLLRLLAPRRRRLPADAGGRRRGRRRASSRARPTRCRRGASGCTSRSTPACRASACGPEQLDAMLARLQRDARRRADRAVLAPGVGRRRRRRAVDGAAARASTRRARRVRGRRASRRR